MDAFFVPIHEYEHPYSIRLWCTSTFEGSSYLMTFDGVKIRLFNFITCRLIKEVDFLKHEALSNVIPVFHPNFPSKAIFVMVRDRRNLIAWDDLLAQIPPLEFDTSLVILSMAWSSQRNTLYIAGNFGWIRSLEMRVQTSISTSVAEWVPKWTKHDSGQWMSLLTIDDNRGMLFGASGEEVFLWNLDDGQLLMKFPTYHTMQISSIRYSSEHLLLFTASADGSIKSWRISEKEASNVQTLKQTPLGPFMIDIDSRSILCISHERILRRYNMLTSSLIGQLDLDPSVPFENKNLDNPLKLTLAFIGSRNEYLFESEAGLIRSYEVHYAPRELAICCETVSNLGSLKDGRLVALCCNNLVHVIYTDGNQGKILDLDRLPISNMPNSKSVPSLATKMVIKDNKVLFGFETGEIKILDVDTNELFETKEPDIGNPIYSVCYGHKMLCKRHVYCNKANNVKDLILSTSSNGGFTIHCPLCYNFIASWKISQNPILQIQQIEKRQLLIGIDKIALRIWRAEEQTVREIASIRFDENEVPQMFTFASEAVVIVAYYSGKCSIYDIFYPDNEDESDQESQEEEEENEEINVNNNDPFLQVRIIHKFDIRLHNCSFNKIISCMDLLKIDGAEHAFKEQCLNGIVSSFGQDDSFCIIDCFTGIIQYKSCLPAHVTDHSASLTFQGKILIALSIDKNIRLLDWPSFVRIIPSPVQSPKSISGREKNHENDDDEEEEEEEEEEDDVTDSIAFYMPHSSHLSNNSSKAAISMSTSNSSSILSPIRQKKSLVVDQEPSPITEVDEKRPRMRISFEDGYPKIVYREEEQQNKQEEEETNSVEVDLSQNKSEIKLFDIFDRKPSIEKVAQMSEYDNVYEKNRKRIQKIIEDDPEIANAFKNKAIKKLKIEEFDNNNKKNYEMDDVQFFNHFLTLSSKPLLKRRKKNKNKNEDEEDEEDYNEKRRRYDFPEEILPIGYRQKCQRSKRYRGQKKKKTHLIVIEFSDGTKLYTNKITINVLKQLATLQNNDNNSHIYMQSTGSNYVEFDGQKTKDLTPGLIFSKALEDLNKKEKEKIEWKPLIQEKKLMSTPVITLTDHGVAYGGIRNNQKIDSKSINEQYNMFMKKVNTTELNPKSFMHWEGVAFGENNESTTGQTSTQNKSVARINLIEEQIEDEIEYEEEEELEPINKNRTNIFDVLFKLRKKNKRKKNRKEKNDYYYEDNDKQIPFNFNDYYSLETNENENINQDQNPNKPIENVKLTEMKQNIHQNNINNNSNNNFNNNNSLDSNNQMKRSNSKNSFKVSTTLFGEPTLGGIGEQEINIFDDNNKITKTLIESTPSLRMFSEIVGQSSNPLLDLINQQTPMTREEINKMHEEGRTEGLSHWKKIENFEPIPHIANTFTFEGLSEKIQKQDIGKGKYQPISPRPMDALGMLSSQIPFGEGMLSSISENSLGEISEDSDFDDSSLSSLSSERDFDRSKFDKIRLKTPSDELFGELKTVDNTYIVEHLQRNDFKDLKGLLSNVGLLTQNGLLDLPRWQPTADFLNLREKAKIAEQLLYEKNKQNQEEEIQISKSQEELAKKQNNLNENEKLNENGEINLNNNNENNLNNNKNDIENIELKSGRNKRKNSDNEDEEDDDNENQEDDNFDNKMDEEIKNIIHNYNEKNKKGSISIQNSEESVIENQNQNKIENNEIRNNKSEKTNRNEIENDIKSNEKQIQNQKQNQNQNFINENEPIENNSIEFNKENVRTKSGNNENIDSLSKNSSTGKISSKFGEEEEIEVEVEEIEEIIDSKGNKQYIKTIVKKKQSVRSSLNSTPNSDARMSSGSLASSPSQKARSSIGSSDNSRINQSNSIIISSNENDTDNENQDKIINDINNEEEDNSLINQKENEALSMSQDEIEIRKAKSSSSSKINSRKAKSIASSSASSIDSDLLDKIKSRKRTRPSSSNQKSDSHKRKLKKEKNDVEFKRLKNSSKNLNAHQKVGSSSLLKDSQGLPLTNTPQSNEYDDDSNEKLIVTGDNTKFKNNQKKKSKKNIVYKGPGYELKKNKEGNTNPLLMHHKSDENLLLDYEDDIKNVDLTETLEENLRHSYEKFLELENILEEEEEAKEEDDDVQNNDNLDDKDNDEYEYQYEYEYEYEESEDKNSKKSKKKVRKVKQKKSKERSKHKQNSAKSKNKGRRSKASQKRSNKRKPVVLDEDEELKDSLDKNDGSNETDNNKNEKKQQQPEIKIVKIPEKPLPKDGQADLDSNEDTKNEIPTTMINGNKTYFTGVLKMKQTNQRPQRTLQRKTINSNQLDSQNDKSNTNSKVFNDPNSARSNNTNGSYDNDSNGDSEIGNKKANGQNIPNKKNKTGHRASYKLKKSTSKKRNSTTSSKLLSSVNDISTKENDENINNNNEEIEENEEDYNEELFDELLKNTTAAMPISDLSQLEATDEDDRKIFIKVKMPQSREKSLGQKVALFKDENDFDSLKLISHNAENKSVQDDLLLSNLKILGPKRFASQEDLLKEKFHEKKQYRVFGLISQTQVPKIFISHYCPPLWDKKTGKLRRGSI